MATQKTATKADSKATPDAVLANPVIKTNAPTSPYAMHSAKARELGENVAVGNTAKFDLAIYLGNAAAVDKDLPYSIIDTLITDFMQATARRLNRTIKPVNAATMKKDRSNFGAYFNLGRTPHGRHMLERIDSVAKETGNAFTRGTTMAVAARKKEMTDEQLRAAAKPKNKSLKQQLTAEAERVEDRVKREREIEDRGDDDTPMSVVAALEVYGKALRAAIAKL